MTDVEIDVDEEECGRDLELVETQVKALVMRERRKETSEIETKCSLAMLMALRWDQISELADTLKELQPSGGTVDASLMRQALHQLQYGHLRDLSAYRVFLERSQQTRDKRRRIAWKDESSGEWHDSYDDVASHFAGRCTDGAGPSKSPIDHVVDIVFEKVGVHSNDQKEQPDIRNANDDYRKVIDTIPSRSGRRTEDDEKVR